MRRSRACGDRRFPRDDELGLVLLGQAPDLGHVDLLGGLIHAVGDHLEEAAREIDRAAVGEVAAVRQIEPENRVSVLQDGEVGRHIGLGPGVRLHVHVVGPEELLGPLDGQRLGHIHELAAPVVALARVSFGILVGQGRSHRLEHSLTNKIL